MGRQQSASARVSQIPPLGPVGPSVGMTRWGCPPDPRSLGMIWYDVVKRLELADASISVL